MPQAAHVNVPHHISCSLLSSSVSSMKRRQVIVTALACIPLVMLFVAPRHAVVQLGSASFTAIQKRTRSTPQLPLAALAERNLAIHSRTVESGAIRSIYVHPDRPWSRAFQYNASMIVGVLLRPVAALPELMNRRGMACRLQSANGLSAAVGKIFRVHGSNEVHGRGWDSVIVYCRFSKPLSNYEEFLNGGFKEAVFDLGETREATATMLPTWKERPFHLTICSPSLHGKLRDLRYRWLEKWLAYYKNRMKVEQFFFYSAMPIHRLLRRLVPVVQKSRIGTGMVSVFDLSSQLAYDTHYYGQLITLYDCLFLNRQMKSKWTLFQDIDELLWLGSRWRTPLQFLAEHERKYKVITFESVLINISDCVQKEQRLKKLNLQYKKRGVDKKPTKGRQKYILQPSAVSYVNIHDAGVKRWKKRLSYLEGHLKHYRGIFNEKNPFCRMSFDIFTPN